VLPDTEESVLREYRGRKPLTIPEPCAGLREHRHDYRLYRTSEAGREASLWKPSIFYQTRLECCSGIYQAIHSRRRRRLRSLRRVWRHCHRSIDARSQGGLLGHLALGRVPCPQVAISPANLTELTATFQQIETACPEKINKWSSARLSHARYGQCARIVDLTEIEGSTFHSKQSVGSFSCASTRSRVEATSHRERENDVSEPAHVPPRMTRIAYRTAARYAPSCRSRLPQ
jgi:hypothetical protein